MPNTVNSRQNHRFFPQGRPMMWCSSYRFMVSSLPMVINRTRRECFDEMCLRCIFHAFSSLELIYCSALKFRGRLQVSGKLYYCSLLLHYHNVIILLPWSVDGMFTLTVQEFYPFCTVSIFTVLVVVHTIWTAVHLRKQNTSIRTMFVLQIKVMMTDVFVTSVTIPLLMCNDLKRVYSAVCGV